MGYKLSRRESQRSYIWMSFIAAMALVLATVGLLVIWLLKSTQLLSVQSASMQPYMSVGDAVLVWAVNMADLKPGDVVTYRSPDDANVLVTHRIVAINSAKSLITTKGDANQDNDNEFHASLIVGRVSTNIENAGYIVDMLRSPAGLIAGVYIPAIVILASEIRRLSWYYKKPVYYLFI